ncbi:hypothetical protein [Nocardia suismassiliense]|uniref:hypothetical protein n=1 Tax=Nocardia suismassiliense TaxID=2077092 RepID=UPI00131F3950|nr:hypothetical protein [Nocardia suismassiliense]
MRRPLPTVSELAELIDPEVWATRCFGPIPLSTLIEFQRRRGESRAAAEPVRAALH